MINETVIWRWWCEEEDEEDECKQCYTRIIILKMCICFANKCIWTVGQSRKRLGKPRKQDKFYLRVSSQQHITFHNRTVEWHSLPAQHFVFLKHVTLQILKHLFSVGVINLLRSWNIVCITSNVANLIGSTVWDTHTHTLTHTHTSKQTHSYAYTQAHAHAHTNIHKHIQGLKTGTIEWN